MVLLTNLDYIDSKFVDRFVNESKVFSYLIAFTLYKLESK